MNSQKQSVQIYPSAILFALTICTLSTVHGWANYKIEPDASDPMRWLYPYPPLVQALAALCPRDEPNPLTVPSSIHVPSQSGPEVELSLRSISSAVQRLDRSGFNSSQPTLLYVHGYLQSKDIPWLQKIRENVIGRFKSNNVNRFNLLIFDWSQVAGRAYAETVTHIPNVGRQLAKFLEAVNEKFMYSMDKLHLIGFSLGAHIVGVAGRQLAASGNKVRQITGIDPAGPCFYTSSNFGLRFTLSQDAADAVIVRHYSYSLLGARSASGDIDIYVNGGIQQPGSNVSRLYDFVAGGREHASSTVHENKITSPSKGCYSIAYKCDSYKKFAQGQCANCSGNGCYDIDSFSPERIRRPTRSIKMFLKTGFDQTCLHHYQVVAQIKSNVSTEASKAFRAGRVRLRISSGDLVAVTDSEVRCEKDIVYTALIASENELSNLDEIKFAYFGLGAKPVKLKDFEVVRLNYMSHPEAHVRRSKSLTFCPSEYKQDILEACSSPHKGRTC